jgi:hypothetical protein
MWKEVKNWWINLFDTYWQKLFTTNQEIKKVWYMQSMQNCFIVQ